MISMYAAFDVNVKVAVMHAKNPTFPAVTVCNTNPVKKSQLGTSPTLQKILKNEGDDVQHHEGQEGHWEEQEEQAEEQEEQEKEPEQELEEEEEARTMLERRRRRRGLRSVNAGSGMVPMLLMNFLWSV